MRTTKQCMLTGMLVLMAALAMVTPVSADDYWKGAQLETELSGTVNGDVDVLFADTWTATGSVTDWSKQEKDVQFTLKVNPQSNPVKFARLYVVPYLGNMTADYTGNLTVTVDSTKVVDSQPLDLSYDRTVGATYNTSVSSPLLDLSRVTSDYVAVIDVTNLVAAKTTTGLDVNVITHNLTGKFDGRIKEVKLVYGWNVTSGGADTKYWVNEGHDPITKNIGTYTDNKTWFNGTTDPEEFTAELWVDYLASASGTYTWNSNAITPTVTQGTYAGLGHLTWSGEDTPGVEPNNALTYNRSGSWYKLITAVFTLKET